jgi:hypothetical protein
MVAAPPPAAGPSGVAPYERRTPGGIRRLGRSGLAPAHELMRRKPAPIRRISAGRCRIRGPCPRRACFREVLPGRTRPVLPSAAEQTGPLLREGARGLAIAPRWARGHGRIHGVRTGRRRKDRDPRLPPPCAGPGLAGLDQDEGARGKRGQGISTRRIMSASSRVSHGDVTANAVRGRATLAGGAPPSRARWPPQRPSEIRAPCAWRACRRGSTPGRRRPLLQLGAGGGVRRRRSGEEQRATR